MVDLLSMVLNSRKFDNPQEKTKLQLQTLMGRGCVRKELMFKCNSLQVYKRIKGRIHSKKAQKKLLGAGH